MYGCFNLAFSPSRIENYFGLFQWSEVCHIFELGGGNMYTDLLTAPISTANLKHLSLILVLDLSKPSEIWDSIENITSTVRNLVMTAAQIENKTSQLKDAARVRVGEINEVTIF